MAPAFGAPERTQSVIAPSCFEPVPFCPASSESLDNGFGEALTFFVAGPSLPGKEVAQNASDLPFDIAETVLLLLGLGLDLDRQLRFLQLPEELIGRWPLCQSLAQLSSDSLSPAIVFDDLFS